MNDDRPKALDLFCGAGGASMGLYRAGYDVTGVDIVYQKNYPFHFIQADALTLTLEGYDLIWASPPCQGYSEATPMHCRSRYPDLIAPMRERLAQQKAPFIIENVEGARRLLLNPFLLCGSMFGLPIFRHRYFEFGNSETYFLVPPCRHDYKPVLITGGSPGSNSRKRGARNALLSERRLATGIDWMTRYEIAQAIPPAYSEFLARQIVAVVGAGPGAAHAAEVQS